MGLIDDRWEARAVQEAVDAAKAMTDGEFITPRTPIGSLSDNEWGWYVTAIIFAWIKVRAQQAVEEGTPGGRISMDIIGKQEPGPWDRGALEACLPALGDIVERVGAEKPLGSYSKTEIVELLWTVIKFYQAAEAARDIAEQHGVVERPAGTYGQEMMAG